MHRAWPLAVVLAFFSGVALTLAAQDLTDDVRRADAAWVTTRAAGDKARYANLLAQEFTWTFITGRVVDKKESVETLRAGPSPELSSNVRVYRDAAVVVGTAKLIFEGRPVTERFVRVWAKEADAWRAVLFQATEIRQ